MTINEIISEALKTLKAGGVILYPTDTVWGLGCDATNEEAVRKIFEIKRRSEAKSLVLLASDMDMVAMHVKQIPNIAIDLVEVNDSPMTIIYPGAQYLAPSVIAEDGSVGIRIPLSEGGGDFCKQLIRKLRRPLVSTSANISGEPTPAGFDEISKEILDAVDFTVPKFYQQEGERRVYFDAAATGKSSQIIKLGLRGEVEIIRS